VPRDVVFDLAPAREVVRDDVLGPLVGTLLDGVRDAVFEFGRLVRDLLDGIPGVAFGFGSLLGFMGLVGFGTVFEADPFVPEPPD